MREWRYTVGQRGVGILQSVRKLWRRELVAEAVVAVAEVAADLGETSSSPGAISADAGLYTGLRKRCVLCGTGRRTGRRLANLGIRRLLDSEVWKTRHELLACMGYSISVLVAACCGHPRLTPKCAFPMVSTPRSTDDLKVKVLGGFVTVARSWTNGRWYINPAWADLKLTFDSLDGSVSALDRAGSIYERSGNGIYIFDKRFFIQTSAAASVGTTSAAIGSPTIRTVI